jgi:hypothetical protein
MLKLILILLNLSLAVLFLSLISWFETKEIEIQAINKKHKQDIQALQKIPDINKAIIKYVRPTLKIQPKSAEEADLRLIQFYDHFADQYNFKVKKYIFSDTLAHYIDIEYDLKRNDKKQLLHFMQTAFKSGFIEFQSFNVNKDKLRGALQVIQPFTDLSKIKQQEVPEDVPQ